MTAPDTDIKWVTEDGPECPDWGATCRSRTIWITDEEQTGIWDCLECDFIIETSNSLAHESRAEQIHKRSVPRSYHINDIHTYAESDTELTEQITEEVVDRHDSVCREDE
jgi:hypothetical protein